MKAPSTSTTRAGSTHHGSQRIGPSMRIRPSAAGRRVAVIPVRRRLRLMTRCRHLVPS